MEYKELLERVDWGEEFSFYYQEEKYWISQNSEGNYLTKVNGEYTQCFNSTEDLFELGKIEDKTIAQIWDEIKEQF